MHIIKFNFSGHPNLLGAHKNTFEFTKDKDLTKKGDCIIGVNSDFNLNELKNLSKKYKKAKIIINSNEPLNRKKDEKKNIEKEEIIFYLNKYFDDDRELVIRKSDYISKRTFGIKAEKSAYELNRELIKNIKQYGGFCEIIPLE